MQEVGWEMPSQKQAQKAVRDELIKELNKVVRSNGDTYSSYEVINLIKRAAHTIKNMQDELKD